MASLSAAAPAPLELPTDRPRTAARGTPSATHPFAFGAPLARALERLARSEGAGLDAVLLAGWQVLLGRYARQAQVTVAGARAGTRAARADLSGDPAFRELVARARDAAPDPGGDTASPAAFALHPDGLPEPGALAGEVALHAARDGDGLAGAIEYAPDLFDAATAARMAGHLRTLLAAAAAAPGRRVFALPLLPDDEHRTVVRVWSGAGEACSAEGALHQRFEAHAAERPQAVALTCDGASLGYGELNARANRLARRLRALGVAPESRVGLCAERSLDLVTGILAILKAGGAYVPLDPAYPAERLAYMAQDSGIRVLVAGPELAGRVPGHLRTVCVDEVPADGPAGDLGVPVLPANLAYVIYTSGSTGRPKGVGVTHASVLRLFACTHASFGFGPEDVWTLFHSCAFDFSVWEIWGALLYGGRLVVVRWAVSRDPAGFRALLARERVTVLSQTPSAFRALAAADEDAAEPLAHLRLVVFGGEALQYAALRGWLDRYGPRRPRLVNMYGITETTVHVTWHTVTGAELRPGAGAGTVGVPIPDLRTYVLEPAGHPAPAGVPGELHVGGAGLARGYLGRPALTAERFVPDPFSPAPGARLYRSGDLGRWRADGTLEYLGRIDQQVKVRGFRIEPGEIEAALLAQPGVAAAAVVLRGHGDDAALAAYVVPAGEAPGLSALREGLKRRLPDHMLPAAIVAVERIPLTANGKLDRAALPEPAELAAPGADPAAGAPRTPLEAALAGIWAEVLRRERVGVDEDFFALGGHSLRATQVLGRIRETLGVPLPLRALFDTPTIAGLAEQVRALRGGRAALPPVVPVPRGGAGLPLSSPQERLWFLHRLQPGSTTYNHPTALRLRGELDARALERALGEVVRRHESLRTVFPERNGAPVQVAVPFAGLGLPVEDLSALPPADRAERERQVVRQVALHVFDLAAGPLFGARLLRLDRRDHLLLLCTHHVVTDGWSTGVLVRELSALYGAFVRGEPSPLPELEVQYGDYAAWQRETLAGDALHGPLEYWRAKLAGAPAVLELPADRPRPPVQSHRGAMERLSLDPEARAGLEALARAEGATLFMVLLAVWQLLLSRCSGQDDVVVGSPVANRTRPEVEGLIGFFANTLALRTDLSGGPTFRQLLARVKQTTLEAYEHQEVPFEKLVEELRVERDLSRNPLFQAGFALHDAAHRPAPMAGLQLREEHVPREVARFDLVLALGEQDDGGVSGVLEYATDLFDAATVLRMRGRYLRLLRGAAAHPDRPVRALEMMSAAERRQVVLEWNGTDAAWGGPLLLHERVAAQAARSPGAEAVVFEDERLSYAELESRACRLARHLQGLGVGPEVRVGVCLERSAELVVALYAVLKAGGAYVPLDPGYPAERLAYMVEDSGAAVLLTRSALRERLAGAGGEVVCLDERAERLAAERDAPVRSAAVPENLAYVIYTSGSTGRPKGVCVEHRAIANVAGAQASSFGVGAGDRVLQFASPSFDASVFEAVLALAAGAALHLAPAHALMPGPGLARLLRDRAVTAAVLPPSALAAMEHGDFPALRTLMVAGEACPADAVDRWAPGRAFFNLYGPTEAAIWSTEERCVPGGGAPCIGRPVANTRAYVLDAGMGLVPPGIPGELYLGGAGVARGYLGRAALTAERFVPDPAGGQAGARLYRTGDRARWRADGRLEFLGRVDQQVKLRGFRIEPGEVESALRGHPGVDDAAVRVHGEGLRARLVAYVTGAAAPAAEALLRHARGRLPEHMVPAAVVRLDALPLTPNGKVDRAALPAPDWEGAREYVEPRTETEALLAGVWAEVLGVSRVGAGDEFFALGGHSLLATRAAFRVREIFGVELPVGAFFQAATLERLAERIEHDLLAQADPGELDRLLAALG